MNKYSKEYNEVINQFEMVGSNVLFLRKDGYIESNWSVLSEVSALDD